MVVGNNESTATKNAGKLMAISIAMAMQRLGCIFLFSGIYFLGPKNRSWQDSWGFLFFFCVFLRNFWQERGFGEVAGIPFFSDFTGIFRRNSCGEEFLPETLSFLQHVLLVWGVNLLTLVCKLLFFYVQIMRYSENRKFTDKEICKWADFP